MSAAEVTTEEMLESLTGYDEVSIAKQFGAEVTDLAQNKPMTLLRALVFVQEKRTGKADGDAKKAVMGMSIKEVNAYFAESAEDFDPSNPVTDSGKEGSQPE